MLYRIWDTKRECFVEDSKDEKFVVPASGAVWHLKLSHGHWNLRSKSEKEDGRWSGRYEVDMALGFSGVHGNPVFDGDIVKWNDSPAGAMPISNEKTRVVNIGSYGVPYFDKMNGKFDRTFGYEDAG